MIHIELIFLFLDQRIEYIFEKSRAKVAFSVSIPIA